MAITYTGEPGRVYSTISVGGSTLSPVPGQSYDIDDPGDGRWSTNDAVKPVETPTEGTEN